MLLTSTDAREMFIHAKIKQFNNQNVIKVDLYEPLKRKFKFNDLCIKKQNRESYARIIACVSPVSFGQQPCYLVYLGTESLDKISDDPWLDLYAQDDFEDLFKYSYAYLKNL